MIKELPANGTLVEKCLAVKEQLVKDGVYIKWRISPEPFRLTKEEISVIESLGRYFYQFYKASNKLYYESVSGRQPAWVAGYLDQGKPQALVEYVRMNRMKGLLPGVIRPDIILTEDGMIASELDSVPGGIGKTGSLGMAYSTISKDNVAGGSGGMITGFMNMLKTVSGTDNPVTAIVVSEESGDYRDEMKWVAKEIRERGGKAYCIKPEEVVFTEDGLLMSIPPLEKGDKGGFEGKLKIDVLYRFFELFDLKNIPKSELIMYSAKKKKVAVTPPFKHFLEEKLLFALFHHPALKGFWVKELGEEGFNTLHKILPATWILDPAEMPPYGVIPDLKIRERPVSSWKGKELADATQGEREFIIKPSGFSELAWGSRGVVAGHDISQEEWRSALNFALEDFQKTPHVLQKFHSGRHVDVSYLEEPAGEIKVMRGRVRLCPYYFADGEEIKLSGIMATICGLEKKLIHGMADAVITVAGYK
ncbi:MAG: hypothetical protein PH343_04845 [Nitrospira sp.]|nr:hypothetical protein [Nitrospira sp.]